MDAPGSQTIGCEFKLSYRRPHIDERVGNAMLSLKRAVEEHVASSAGSGDLASDRAFLYGGVVRVVNEFICDL
jgi:hypothetical protein